MRKQETGLTGIVLGLQVDRTGASANYKKETLEALDSLPSDYEEETPSVLLLQALPAEQYNSKTCLSL